MNVRTFPFLQEKISKGRCNAIRKFLTILGWCLLIGGFMAAIWFVSAPENQVTGPVTVVCMQTEDDADASLLYQEGAAVLIDTGEETDADHILEVLEQYGVTRLDYLILYHPDADHIGGAMKILSKIQVERVVQPYYPKENKRLKKLNEWLDEQGIPVIYPTRTRRLQAGGMRLLVYPPMEKKYNDSNNYSLGVLVQHNDVNLMFAGDALRKRSEELLSIDWPEISLYKVAHHGRANSASEKLFRALQPRYAVVTARSADEIIQEVAGELGTTLYYTAEGDQVFVSDGIVLTPQ